MNAGLPFILTLTPLNCSGILPTLNSGAVLHTTPSPTLAGARFVPLISIQAFCDTSGLPPAVFTDVITTGVPAAEGVNLRMRWVVASFTYRLPPASVASATGPPSDAD